MSRVASALVWAPSIQTSSPGNSGKWTVFFFGWGEGAGGIRYKDKSSGCCEHISCDPPHFRITSVTRASRVLGLPGFQGIRISRVSRVSRAPRFRV